MKVFRTYITLWLNTRKKNRKKIKVSKCHDLPRKVKKKFKIFDQFRGILDLAIFIREGHNLWIFLSVGDSNFFTKARTAHSKYFRVM